MYDTLCFIMFIVSTIHEFSNRTPKELSKLLQSSPMRAERGKVRELLAWNPLTNARDMYSWSQQLAMKTKKVSSKELHAFKTPPSDPTIACQKIVCGDNVLFLPKYTPKTKQTQQDSNSEGIQQQERHVLGKSIQELMKDADK